MILGSTRPSTDPYALAARALGVDPSAGEGEIRTAYRRVAHDNHPDRNAGAPNQELLTARFRLATAARALLLARSGNQDVRPLLKDFQSAQQWYNQEARKAGVAATQGHDAPRAAQAGPTAGMRAGSTGAGAHAQTGPQGATQSDAFKNARSWVPPEFKTDDANVYRSNASGWRSATSEEAAKARPWTPPDFGTKAGQESAPPRDAAGSERPQGAGAEAGKARAASEKTGAETSSGGAAAGFTRSETRSHQSGAAATQPDTEPVQAKAEPAPVAPEASPVSEGELRRRKAGANAYAQAAGAEYLGRHVNLEV